MSLMSRVPSRFAFMIILLLLLALAPVAFAAPVGPYSEGAALPALKEASPAAAMAPEVLGGSGSGITAAGNWLLTQQLPNGGFPWTPGGTVSEGNIQGPIAGGLLDAYEHSGVVAFKTAATETGNLYITAPYLQSFTDGDPRFATYDPLFLEQLSIVTGGPQYATFADTYFWSKLAAGTYGETNDLDAAEWAALVTTNRTAQGLLDLVPWDISAVAIGAQVAGETATRDAVMAEILTVLNATTTPDNYDIIGLAGAVWAAGVTGTNLDPTSGPYASIDSTAGLAAKLATFQYTSGSWASGTTEPNPGDWQEAQTTAFALLALDAADPVTFQLNIAQGAAFLRSLQDANGEILSWVGAGPNDMGSTETHAEALTALVTVAPSVVYVDDDWISATAGADPDGAGPALAYGYDAFATIAEGLDAVTTGGTVNVAAGTYVEDPVIERAVTLLGPNAAINPNTGTRVAEALILPTLSIPDPSGSCELIVYVKVSDVTIKGFTFDGDNPALTSGILIDGADVDACELIAGYEGVGNIVIENNILKHSTYTGIEFYNYTNSAATAGNYIRYNRLEDIGETTYNWGIGILLYNNFYADVTDNVLTGVRTGVQTGNFFAANPGTTGSIRNNQIGVWRLGIFHNLAYSSASPFTLADNTITAETYPGANKWNGILLSSLGSAVDAVVTGNAITIPGAVSFTSPGYTAGYNVWNVTTTAPIAISGGTVTGGDYGVFVNNYEGYSSNANNTAIKVDGVTVLGTKVAGVYVKDSPSNTNGATVYANIQNATIDTDATGILVEGADATAKANLNNLDGNPVTGLTNTNPLATVDAENNWWGTPCEPSAKVSGLVDYTPWWGDATGSFSLTANATAINVGDSAAQQMAVINCAAPGTSITYPTGVYPGGVTVTANGVTIDLGGSTVGAGSPAYTIVGDDVTLMNGILDGNGAAFPGVLVNAGADNFTLKDAEVREWADGVQVAGAVESLKIIGNWFHDNTDAGLQVDAAVTGVVNIEGNLFKENDGNGIESAVAIEAQYNSWGHIDGAASGDGASALVDVTNPTYVEYWLDIQPDLNPAERRLSEGDTFDVALKADACLLYGLTFEFTQPAELTLGVPVFSAPWAGACVNQSAGDVVKYECHLQGGTEWDGGTIATFPFTVETLSSSPLERWFDIAHAAPATSAAAIGGVKVYVNNAGFGAPSVPARDITDPQDSGKLILGKLAQYKGFIDLQGRANDAGATLLVKNQQAYAGSVDLARGTSAAGGGYTTALLGAYELFQGETYYFQVDRALYLPTTPLMQYMVGPVVPASWLHGKQLNTALTTVEMVVLLGGDATDNNLIDTLDATCIGGRYGLTPAACGAGLSDVNEDGKMDILDLTLMGGNFTKAASPWTVAP